MAIKNWSTTPASNNSAAPNGFKEGMPPGDMNDSARQVMADVRAWYEATEFVDRGDTPSYVSFGSVSAQVLRITATLSGGASLVSQYPVGTWIWLFDGTNNFYGNVWAAPTYSNPDTTIDIYIITTGVSPVAVFPSTARLYRSAIQKTNPSVNFTAVGYPVVSGEVGVKNPEYYYTDPRRFGCLIDGTTDDADNFFNCMSSTKLVELPEGTMLIAGGSSVGDFMCYLGTQGGGGHPTSRDGMTIRGQGKKSIIKLGDSIGNGHLLFGGANGDTLNDMTFQDFAIDLNAANNLQVNFADPLRYNQAFYMFCPCNNFLFENLYIYNGSGAQFLRCGDDTAAGYGTNIKIHNCHFEAWGISITSNNQQDCSCVYLQADGIEVSNNIFECASFTFDLSRGHTGVELHGDTDTKVLGNTFRNIQLPVLIAQNNKDTRNVTVSGNNFYECNYFGQLDPGGTNDYRGVIFSDNNFFSTKTSSSLFIIGNSSESAKVREHISIKDNIIDLTGNTNQGTPFIALDTAYLSSIVIDGNTFKSLNGSVIYVSGTVRNTNVLEIFITNNVMDSLGATSGAYPNSPTFVHTELSAGAIDLLVIEGNTLNNTDSKTYTTFGAFKIEDNINKVFIRNNHSNLANTVEMVADVITNWTYKSIDNHWEGADYVSDGFAIAGSTSVNISTSFASMTGTEYISLDATLHVNDGGSNKGVINFRIIGDSSGRTAQSVATAGTYAGNFVFDFSGTTLRVTSTTGTAVTGYLNIKGQSTKVIDWLV